MLGIKQLASFHAALLAGAPWDELLRNERVTRAQWLAAERACLDALAAESAAGGFELRDLYLRAFYGVAPAAPSGPTLPFEPSTRVPSTPLRSTEIAPQVAPAPRPAAPASPDASPTPEIPALALQQYVSLQVELDLHPQRRAETLTRYHISEAQLAELEAAYVARIAADPQLRAEWDAAYASSLVLLVASSSDRTP